MLKEEFSNHLLHVLLISKTDTSLSINYNFIPKNIRQFKATLLKFSKGLTFNNFIFCSKKQIAEALNN